MTVTNWYVRPEIARRSHRGQVLVVALAVLFVLLFIGGLFVAMVARNLINTGRSRDVQSAQNFADAGIQFCSDALTNSPDGADWRPEPTAPVNNADPDFYWLSLGFTRLPLTGGRALVRVIYDPRTDDPRSQYLRIEAIGRVGEVPNPNSPADPTVFVQNGPAPRLRAERIAYKAIGLTDFLRFVTNIDRNSNENFLGTPSIGVNVGTSFGDPTIAANPTGSALDSNGKAQMLVGGPIRINSDVKIGGDTYFFFSQRGNTDQSSTPEGLLVSGKIQMLPTRLPTDKTVFVNQPMTATVGQLLQSTDPAYNTVGGFVRDGSTNSDINGYTRQIPRLDPPRLDTYVAGSGVMRYRALTRDSGHWVSANFNTGQNGWGTGIYVNNTEDLQTESSGVAGSYSLRSDWIDPRTNYRGYWNGPYYVPPGVDVELLGDHLRLTRHDSGIFYYPNGTPVTQQGGHVIDIPLTDWDRQHYTLPDGTVFPLPPLSHDGDDPAVTGGPARPFTDPYSYGVSIVMMAEGNLKVHGVFGTTTNPTQTAESASIRKLARVHITLVSGSTAYIDGNVVKGDDDRASTCAILAKDYVCVNTTQFMSPRSTGPWTLDSSYQQNSYKTEVGPTSRPYAELAFSFGVNPATYQVTVNGNKQTAAPYLFLRHAAQTTQGTMINLLVNPGLGGAPYDFGLLNGNTYTYPVGWKPFNNLFMADTVGYGDRFERTGITLPGNANFLQTPGLDNILRFQVDQTVSTLYNFGVDNYQLGAPMVAPLDIRIEAMIYAQNRSFFIIPGQSLNPDPSDTRQRWQTQQSIESAQGITPDNANSRLRPSYSPYDTPLMRQLKDAYPFYGEPMDVRLTIYGTVSENFTASMGDQAAWMRNWGFIPVRHGSTAQWDGANPVAPIPDDHRMVQDPVGYNSPATDRTQDYRSPLEQSAGITRGLRFIYDPALGLAYDRPTELINPVWTAQQRRIERDNRALRALRRTITNNNGYSQAFVQRLPALPRLPVAPGLLYYGDSDRPIDTL